MSFACFYKRILRRLCSAICIKGFWFAFFWWRIYFCKERGRSERRTKKNHIANDKRRPRTWLHSLYFMVLFFVSYFLRPFKGGGNWETSKRTFVGTTKSESILFRSLTHDIHSERRYLRFIYCFAIKSFGRGGVGDKYVASRLFLKSYHIIKQSERTPSRNNTGDIMKWPFCWR